VDTAYRSREKRRGLGNKKGPPSGKRLCAGTWGGDRRSNQLKGTEKNWEIHMEKISAHGSLGRQSRTRQGLRKKKRRKSGSLRRVRLKRPVRGIGKAQRVKRSCILKKRGEAEKAGKHRHLIKKSQALTKTW